ncbi:hypothetical protein L5515_019672 [Caenorhabditis briggsae]|uniref:Uncharacterized protein n=1 Tax=Caenorhabditis briggsae TaxID=6238 RepID=A0AAE9FEN8_CAEBR|nr:hypothetical protein L5515_019672 [Caenorhabditis briggsae]
MKFHMFIDHMASSIRFHGSPLISSASSFERLNQTLGRSSNAYTTRTLINISNRFMGMKRASEHCSSSLYQKEISTPKTMSAFLDDNDNDIVPEEKCDKSLKDAVKDGNVLRVGSTIRKGFDDQSISDLQFEELVRVSPKPTISLFQFHKQLENASSPEKKDLMMGQMFLTKMDDKSIQILKASVSSLSHNFAEKTKIGILTKRTLEGVHVIEPIDEFPRIDIMHIYYKHSLIGDCAFSQMTNFLTRVLKNALNPPYHIWNYSYRPKCVRSTDKHFQLLPEQVSDTLLDFSYDVVGVFLPDHLLYGKISENESFLKTISGDPMKEIRRRRDKRENVAETSKSSIGHMLYV